LFIREAGQVIVLMVLALNVLNSIGTDGSFGNEDTDHSVLSAVGKAVTPAFSSLGITEENWPATVGIFTGVMAKEAVVGTLNSIYSNLAADEAGEVTDQPPWSLTEALMASFATVPENLAAVRDNLLDPLGMDVGDISDSDAAAAQQEVNSGVFGAMASRFDGQIGAFAYLLFVLLYFPCAATIGAIVREAGSAWAVFVAVWTTGVAYTAASVFYQVATFERHPATSAAWLIGLGLLIMFAFVGLRIWAARGESEQVQSVEAKL
jgi:ferrous iron transport protein B